MNYKDYIAVDDIEFLTEECDHAGSCEFDDGLCGYTNSMLGKLDWMVGRGKTKEQDILIGPVLDASKSGMYAYVDFTNPFITRGYRTYLRSDEIYASSISYSFCLEFSYIMFGKDARLFQVLVDRTTLEELSQSIWESTEADQTTVWKTKRIDFNSTTEFEVVFGTQKFGPEAFLGIDNIILTPDVSCNSPLQPNETQPVPKKILECDFEEGKICSGLDPKPSSKWKVQSGIQAQTIRKEPKFDHTKNSERGQYLTAVAGRTGLAVITTEQVNNTHKACFQFWYFIYGSIRRFEIVTISEDGTEKVLWNRIGDQVKWRYAQIDVTAVNFKLALKGANYYGYIAVDDLTLLTSSCPEERMCTFDDGHMCSFKQSTSSDFDWRVTKQSSKPFYFPYDHTTNSFFGNYLYLNTSGQRDAHSAQLESPVYPAGQYCFQFWYYTTYSDAIIEIGTKTHNNVEYEKHVESVSDNLWISASVEVNQDEKFQFTITSYAYQQKSTIDVALDDIEILTGACPSTGVCDFESDMCSWQNDLSATYDWQRRSGHSNNIVVPKYDHSTGLERGYYLTVTPPPSNLQMTSALVSPIISNKYRCFSFWYYTVSMTTYFELIIQYSSVTVKEKEIARINITKENSWEQVFVDIKQQDNYENYLIKINYEAGIGAKSLSIDDLYFDEQTCDDLSSVGTFYCDNNETILKANQICDFIEDCKDGLDETKCGKCNFDNSQCGYQDNSKELFVWSVGTSSDAINKTKNVISALDHTTGDENGKYMFTYLKGRGGYVTKPAQIHSPLIQFANPMCHLSFWQYNSELNYRYYKLMVNIAYQSSKNAIQVSSSQGVPGEWNQVHVYIGRIHEPFTIQFTTSQSTNYLVAVDDVWLTDCGGPENSVTNCTESEIRCNDDKPSPCIKRTQECDMTPDCNNGKDEEDCESKNYKLCDFEESMCMWEYSITGYLEWKIMQARYGFRRDHTLNSQEGHYLVAASSRRGVFRILSRSFTASSNCTMRFYYTFFGNIRTNYRLRVLTITEMHEASVKEWFRNDRKLDSTYFIREEIQLSLNNPFQILLEAYITGYGSVLVDDVSFDSECKYAGVDLPNATYEPQCKYVNQLACDSSKCLNPEKVCNFEKDCDDGTDEENCGESSFTNGTMSGWTDSSAGIYRWKAVPVYYMNESPYAPIRDHTSNSVTGWYMGVIDTQNSHSAIPKAYLESPKLGKTASSCVFSFAYHTTAGDGTLKLNIRNWDINVERTLLVLKGNKPQQWTEVNVTVGLLPPGYQLVFEATVANEHLQNRTPDFVIDDTKFKDCSAIKEDQKPSTKSLNCSFEENNFCAWYQDLVNTQLMWKIGNGSTPTPGTGPEYDHSLSGKGHYIYIEKVDRYSSIERSAQINSPVQAATSKQGRCFSLWYHMFGEQVGSLSISLLDGNASITEPELIWSMSTSQGNVWRYIEINIIRDIPFQIILESTSGSGWKNNIAVDDLVYSYFPCKKTEKENTCNFEIDNCGWVHNRSNSDANWKRLKMSQIYNSGDHTTNSRSGYILGLRNKPSKTDSVTNVTVSNPKTFQSSAKGSCFQFWYYITKRTNLEQIIATVKITRPTNTSTFSKVYISDVYAWNYAQVDIPPNVKYNLEITASSKSSLFWLLGNFLLDDFRLKDESCEPDGNCNFEDGLCGWRNEYSSFNRLNWLRSAANTPSEYSGPSSDHTKGDKNGFYIFLDSSSLKAGTAKLTSPELSTNESNTACISLYYHMFGQNVGSLKVSVVLSNQREIEVFAVDGNKEDQWNPADVEVHNLTSKFYVIIAGNLLGQPSGDIAVDDISIMTSECSIKEVKPPQTTTTEKTTITSKITSSSQKSTTTDKQTTTTKKGKPISETTPQSSSSTLTIKTTKSSSKTTGNEPSSSKQTSSFYTPSTEQIPTSTSTSPSKTCQNGYKRCRGGTPPCVRTAFLCDGYKDCSDGADEENCVITKNCTQNQFACSSGECVPKINQCDGKPHCKDESDEGLCDCSSDDVCVNKGTCKSLTNKPMICVCTKNFRGSRCQFSALIGTPPHKNLGWVAAVVLGIIAVAIIAVVIYFKKFRNVRNNENSPMTIDNPVYDFPSQDEYQTFAFHESDTTVPNPLQNPNEPEEGGGIVNPLYK